MHRFKPRNLLPFCARRQCYQWASVLPVINLRSCLTSFSCLNSKPNNSTLLLTKVTRQQACTHPYVITNQNCVYIFACAGLWMYAFAFTHCGTFLGTPPVATEACLCAKDWYHKSLQFGLVSFQIAFTLLHQLCHRVTVCVCLSHVIQSHTERTVPTRLKKHCPEVGCPFPTGSPFQRLEIPLCTKRPDMIPQHCRRGRELGTVLIRQELLSGKILKGMQPIVVNCMEPHSIPSAAGMCFLFWIGEMSILTSAQCLCFVLESHFGFVLWLRSFFFPS